ncbi:hypothetical protein HCN44_004862 [Aphidius gifuensis]|uniref:Uncharacterized protein n=1 Tax=Aphidius gifuensis TaxID=684658 RepID=A0A834XS98_APHGI|nr:hypothetical protein HCN44_004862 [Aphidius gifuensis]
MSWTAGPNQQSISPLLRFFIDDKSLTISSNNINLLDEEQIIDESFDKHLKSPSTSSTTTTTFKSIKNTKINSPTLGSHSFENDPTTSETADLKYGNTNDCSFDIVESIANTCKRYAEGSAGNSLSEYLGNINPPSLLNEVSEIDDTTVDANTDTMCRVTLCMDIELLSEELGVTHTFYLHKIDENDNDSDGATTPIPTEYSLSSSADKFSSTRDKRRKHNKEKEEEEEEKGKNSSEFDIKKNDATDKSQSLMKSRIPSFKGITGRFKKKHMLKIKIAIKQKY